MGYTTEFTGHVTVTPPLNADEIAYLQKFNETRRMNRTKGPYYVQGSGFMGQGHDADVLNHNEPPEGQPGLWCKWEPSLDGTQIQWDGAEKFYNPVEWMRYLIDHFLRPDAPGKTQTVDAATFFTFGDHVVNGVIEAQGEESSDVWFLIVQDNVVTDHKAFPEGVRMLA